MSQKKRREEEAQSRSKKERLDKRLSEEKEKREEIVSGNVAWTPVFAIPESQKVNTTVTKPIPEKKAGKPDDGWGLIKFVLGSVFLLSLCGVSFQFGEVGTTETGIPITTEAIGTRMEGMRQLRATLRDPGSLEIIDEGVYGSTYWARYRAKNGFGGYVVETFWSE